MQTKRILTLLLIPCLLWMAGCNTAETDQAAAKAPGTLTIIATTGMIADAVSNVAGEKATVEALMGPGVDPHLYKATQGDLAKLKGADMIFYNGLHLEGKMGDVLEKLAKNKPVIAVGGEIAPQKLLKSAQFADAYDPHIWFDVSLWIEAVNEVKKALSAKMPEHATTFAQNATTYRKELTELHQWVGEQIASIPQAQRVLITAHDAFEYFGRAYQIEVKGLQGISTVSEYGLQDLSEMVTFIVDHKIKAVFVESSVPRKSLEAVIEGCEQRGHAVKIGGTLFSDAMGEAGSPEGNYLGMVKYNVSTIVQNLK